MVNGMMLQSLSLEHRLAPSSFVAIDRLVSPKSNFGDAVWKMEDLVTTPGVSAYPKSWDFSTVPGYPNGFALSFAEYAFARMYTPVATHERDANWLTVHNELVGLTAFAKFCYSKGVRGCHEVDAALYISYLRFLQFGDDSVAGRSDERVRKLIKYVYSLWEYRSVISEPLRILPFGKPLEKLFGKVGDKSGEGNATPVIPEAVYAAVMSAALDYVLTHSTTIVETWQALRKEWETAIDPLPLSGSGKNKRFVKTAKSIVSSKRACWRIKDWSSHGDVYAELQQLRVACITVILAYSGIRSSELLDLRAGCYVTDVCADGRPRYYINSSVRKHREKGSRDTWVVVDEVVTAIKVLELLTVRVRTESNDPRLMLTDGSNAFFSVGRCDELSNAKVLTGAGIISQLNRFQHYCNRNLKRPPIPEWTDEDGRSAPWHFNTRQFRRTLARHIARQPFGIVAGMLQYKHVEVAVFQGYAGTEPEWNKLLAQEKVLASIDILEEVAMDLSNGQLAGDFGVKLKEEFAVEFRGRADDFPPSQIAKWLANTNKGLFVGKFNFCFFDANKALCTKGGGMERPVLNFCQPARCANACVGKRHLALWTAQLQQAEEFVAHPKVSPFQRESLERELADIRSVVTNIVS